jgi:ssDNA-binding protein
MKVVLKDVRLSFPDLFVPQLFQNKPDSKARYNASFLVEPNSANDKALRAAILEAAKETYGKKADALLKSWENNSNKYCYMDGDLKEYDGYAGMMALSAHRNSDQGAPAVVDRDKNVKLTAADGRPYAGCYVNASVDIYAQQGTYPGIRASLVAVQFVRDGDAFAGTPANTDDFDDLAVSEDETADMI